MSLNPLHRAAALGRWIEAAIVEGPLFRPLGPTACAQDVARISKRHATAAGHSTRVGAAQDMLAHNLALSAIRQSRRRLDGGDHAARNGARLEAWRSAATQLAAIQGR